MTRTAVDQLLYLLDEAFEGNQWHALIPNLATVTEDDWLWTPSDGSRTVRLLTAHVGACKYVYDNHAFGDAAMGWNDPAGDLGYGMEDLQSESILASEPSRNDVISWLTQGHRQLREHVAALDDEELSRPRRNHRDEMKETRFIISTMIEHDLYHAGEINHIRALRQGNDH